MNNTKVCKNCGLVGEDKISFYPRTKLCISCHKQLSKMTYDKKKEEIKDKKNKKSEELVNVVKEIKEMITDVKKENEELKQELREIKTHILQN